MINKESMEGERTHFATVEFTELANDDDRVSVFDKLEDGCIEIKSQEDALELYKYE